MQTTVLSNGDQLQFGPCGSISYEPAVPCCSFTRDSAPTEGIDCLQPNDETLSQGSSSEMEHMSIEVGEGAAVVHKQLNINQKNFRRIAKSRAEAMKRTTKNTRQIARLKAKQQKLITKNARLVHRLKLIKKYSRTLLSSERKQLAEVEHKIQEDKNLVESERKVLQEANLKLLKEISAMCPCQKVGVQALNEDGLQSDRAKENEKLQRLLAEAEQRLKVKEEQMKRTLTVKMKIMQEDAQLQINAKESWAKQKVYDAYMKGVRNEMAVREEMDAVLAKASTDIAQRDQEITSLKSQLLGANLNVTSLEQSLVEAKKRSMEHIEEIVETELQCSICTEILVQATTLKCTHSFCKSCITQWRKRTRKCPICRDRTFTACRTRVLDNFIIKIVESLSSEVKTRWKEAFNARQALARDSISEMSDSEED